MGVVIYWNNTRNPQARQTLIVHVLIQVTLIPRCYKIHIQSELYTIDVSSFCWQKAMADVQFLPDDVARMIVGSSEGLYTWRPKAGERVVFGARFQEYLKGTVVENKAKLSRLVIDRK